MHCLYILEVNPLSVVLFAIIFSYSEGYLLNLFMVFFAVQKFFKFNLIRSHLLFLFNFHYSGRWITQNLAVMYVKECSAYVSL